MRPDAGAWTANKNLGTLGVSPAKDMGYRCICQIYRIGCYHICYLSIWILVYMNLWYMYGVAMRICDTQWSRRHWDHARDAERSKVTKFSGSLLSKSINMGELAPFTNFKSLWIDPIYYYMYIYMYIYIYIWISIYLQESLWIYQGELTPRYEPRYEARYELRGSGLGHCCGGGHAGHRAARWQGAAAWRYVAVMVIDIVLLW